MMNKVKLLSGRSNLILAKKVSGHLKIPLVEIKITDFANTEMSIEIKETVRGFNCYIIQTGCSYEGRSINDHLIESHILINACRLSNAKSINLIMPCFPYARSDKKDAPRVSIASSMQCSIFNQLGVDRIVSFDLHSGQIQGFSPLPFDNLYCINLHIQNLKGGLFNNLSEEEIDRDYILVSPDLGGAKRIESYAKKLGMKHAYMHKKRDYSRPNVVLNSILIGENNCIKNKTVILVDDIFDTLGTMCAAIEELKNFGVKDVILIATHGIFSGQAIERMNNCELIKKVIITNTLPQNYNQALCSKIEVVDISETLSTVIKRLETNENGISELFE